MEPNITAIKKRIRKSMAAKPFKKGDRILVLGSGDAKAAVTEFFLRDILKGFPAEITKEKSAKNSAKYDKIIIPWSLEDECSEFIEGLFGGKIAVKSQKKEIRLLKGVKEEEINAVAKSQKLKFKKHDEKKSKIRIMLDLLEKKYPGYKFALLNSIKELEGL